MICRISPRFIRATLVLAAALAGGVVHAADTWTERWAALWQTADQRGETLLRQGDAGAAAKTFADPRRRAYAELQAGDYAGAARDLATFDDSDAHYNRGNALAQGGDLAGALAAYDAALARDPNNRDARHNRDLVAQAVKQQPPRKQAGQGGAGKQGKSGQGDQSGQQGQGREGKTGQPQSAQAAAGKPGARGQPDQAGQAGAGRNPPVGDSADQARRDAEAGLRRPAGTREPQASPDEIAQGEAGRERGAASEEAPRERQLAREQWLRQIPDDPGGLLRRKFLIEHLMRQQQGNQP